MTFCLEDIGSPEALIEVLTKTDIRVPERTAGRQKTQTESWTICRLLATIGKGSDLAFPISVTHRDAPDFLVSAGSRKIGVEITEAISEQFAWALAIAEQEFSNALLDLGNFRWGTPHRTKEELRKLLRKKALTSDGWSGNHPEQEWALYMQSVIESKLLKLQKGHFEKFDRNWLAIYDNLPLPSIDLKRAATQLQLLLLARQPWARPPKFDVVYVEYGRKILAFSSKGFRIMDLNDLWSKAHD